MERRFKGLVAINDVLDDRYQKLSDRYHSLELSHNRKKEALKKLSRIFSTFTDFCYVVEFETNGRAWNEIRKIVSDALWSDGRERQVPVKKKKITMATLKARKKNNG